VLIVIIVLALVGLLVISISGRLLKKQAGGISQEIELGFGDQDGDSVADKFDACLCVSGELNNDGCPPGVKTQMSNQTLRFLKCTQDYCDKFDLKGCPDNPQSK